MSHKIPSRYAFAEGVPAEGASCATCYYVSEDREHCRNLLYADELGTADLGAKADRWCCMLWSAEKRGV